MSLSEDSHLSVFEYLIKLSFRVTVTTLFSFISAALATTHIICYPAVTSSSVVLILPVSISFIAIFGDSNRYSYLLGVSRPDRCLGTNVAQHNFRFSASVICDSICPVPRIWLFNWRRNLRVGNDTRGIWSARL